MAKMDYTKGDWRVNQESLGADIDIVATKQDGSLDWRHRIAQIQLGWAKSDYSVSNLKANAHLISAAPDLYEALKAVASCEIDKYFLEPLRIQISKAIAKAEKA